MPTTLDAVLACLRDRISTSLPHASSLETDAAALVDSYIAVDPRALRRARKPEAWAAGALHRAALRRPGGRLSAGDVAWAFGVSPQGVALISRQIDSMIPATAQRRLGSTRQITGRKGAPPGPDALYQLRVTLRELAPPIWRRVQVPGRFTLAQLHRVLQAAFGWQEYHLFSFEHGDITYSDAETVAGLGEGREARRTRVHQVLGAAGERMTYTYDFGDGWEHDVVLEAILSPDPGERRATLLDGERAGPPEDCGGPWGFADLLYALDDPEHEWHDELRQWLRECGYVGYRPDRFDRAGATRAVRAVH